MTRHVRNLLFGLSFEPEIAVRKAVDNLATLFGLGSREFFSNEGWTSHMASPFGNRKKWSRKGWGARGERVRSGRICRAAFSFVSSNLGGECFYWVVSSRPALFIMRSAKNGNEARRWQALAQGRGKMPELFRQFVAGRPRSGSPIQIPIGFGRRRESHFAAFFVCVEEIAASN